MRQKNTQHDIRYHFNTYTQPYNTQFHEKLMGEVS